MSCSEIYQIEISESKLIIIFWKVFNVIQRWYMSSFHIVCIWKSEFERIHCHGRVEWGQIEFETKWGNKAEFMKTSHICPSPCFKIKSNINLPNASDHPCLHLYVWQNKCWILMSEYYRLTLYKNDLYHFHNIT